MKRRLENQLGCFEIELLPDGDFLLCIFSKDTGGKIKQRAYLDIPNPINGGGNMEDYKKIQKIYDILKD